MTDVLRFVGPNRSAELFGVQLIGVNAETGAKLLITLVFILLVVVVSRFAQRLVNRRQGPVRELSAFWVRQGLSGQLGCPLSGASTRLRRRVKLSLGSTV